jgi:lipid II:glycine glycyltransferase (peptidoglycan interpeptide bridge formation enzyme)
LLFWKIISEAQERGIENLDLGRCDINNQGLIQYKERLGCTRSTLTYWRMPLAPFHARHYGWSLRMAKEIFMHSPALLRVQLGNRLYKHAG